MCNYQIKQLIHKKCKGSIVLGCNKRKDVVFICLKCHNTWSLENLNLKVKDLSDFTNNYKDCVVKKVPKK